MHPSYDSCGTLRVTARLLVTFSLTLLIMGSFRPSTFVVTAYPASLAIRPTGFWSRQLNDTNPALPSLCTNPPRDQCDFYAECLESQYNCGPTGYPIGFGQKFCNKFDASRAELSAEGQAWITKTMQCLQQDLVPEATSTTGVTCESLRKKAFASHGPCYVQGGVCTLPPSDWAKIVGIVELKSFFDSKESFLATLSAGEGCLKALLFFLKDTVF